VGKRKVAIVASLATLVLGTIGTGIYFKHYFVVFVFAVWLCVEFLLWRLPAIWRSAPRMTLPQTNFGSMAYLLALFEKTDDESQSLLQEKLSELRLMTGLTEYEQRWLHRLSSLVQLRALVFGVPSTSLKGRNALKRGFAYVHEAALTKSPWDAPFKEEDFSIQDITESATFVADLYWKLYDTSLGEYPELTDCARALFAKIFGIPFDSENTRKLVEGLTDSMQRDLGVPYLILNLIRSGSWQWARQLAHFLLKADVEMDEDVRSGLYWICEIHWFTRESKQVLTDYDSSIRYLYHVCFTNPERAGFLEIDSQFFSQFETVSELAREGFLFKESLIERTLLMWKEHQGHFDSVFRGVLESMTQQKSKIYDEYETWERFWKRENEDFCRDYLYVVEGNLSYARGHYADAQTYYEKALKRNPHLRSALFNILFCYAKLGALELHGLAVEKLMQDKSLFPAALYVIGDSFLLLGNESAANAYYEELKKYEGWDRKVDYYKSTFCFENGLFEKALLFARQAFEQNPNDSAISYHLSLCYSALGEKDRALEMVKKMGEAPQWLNYYKFTLERDVGRFSEASETLLHIPSEYFQDPEEFEQALDFARTRKDLVLLRHLRKKEAPQP